jgi:penicillin amidase
MPLNKNLLKAVGVATGVAGSAAAALAYLYRRPLPKTEGTIRLSGLHRPVQVIRDRWGVPHIYAENSQDLFFAQGYVHAQDRLWQMEFNRRIGHGRLSEIFGHRVRYRRAAPHHRAGPGGPE